MVNSHRLMTFMEVGFYSFVFCYIIDIHVIMSLIMAKGGGGQQTIICKGFMYQNVLPIQMPPVTTTVDSFVEASELSLTQHVSKTERDRLSLVQNKECVDEEICDNLIKQDKFFMQAKNYRKKPQN